MEFRIKTSERTCSMVRVDCGGDQIDVYVGTNDAKRIALANSYVKLSKDEMIVKRLETGEVCFGSVNVDEMARKFGYVKLEPGQVVVDEKQHTADLATAAQWANHVRQQQRNACRCDECEPRRGKEGAANDRCGADNGR